MPIVAGSEVNDNPFAPISKYARNLHRRGGRRHADRVGGARQRYVEKLATPDVTIADMIGDLDPIRAARGGHVLSDELTIHYGMLPRANRGIFALNELPDLAGKVQVGLFNVMQEGDVQIKGYPDPPAARRAALLHGESRGLHGARQDHHAAQGSHRQRDHHALSGDGRARDGRSRSRKRGRSATTEPVRVPDFIAEVDRAHRVRGARRTSASTSAPACRSACRSRVMENVVSNAERRAIVTGEAEIVPRISDIYAALPAITGKIELEYEGELVGGHAIARELIRRAADATFQERAGGVNVDDIVMWFDEGGALQVADERAATWRSRDSRSFPTCCASCITSASRRMATRR